ncbi:MAG: transposase, partial [Gemmobacter sp.]|nr:transposase [Gemmobacter sp.]
MRKSRFTKAQIIGMIKEQEAGLPTAELCRKHGLSPATFYIYGRLSRYKVFFELIIPFSQVANIYPASPDIGAPKWEFRVVCLDNWSASAGHYRS